MPTRAPRRRTSAPVDGLQTLEDRRLMSAAVGPVFQPSVTLTPAAVSNTVYGYTPTQIRAGYGLSGLTFNGGTTAATGAGETIAIIDAYNDPNIAADLATFDAKPGVAAASLTVVSQTGSTTALPATNAGWAQEISLDVEWAHAVAPAAKLLLVETSSSSTANLVAGVAYARTVAGVAAISMSWGGSEFSGETSYDATFTTPAGQTGITFVASAGDDGSAAGPEWPAANAGVLSVGGTDLSLTSAGTYGSETAWAHGGGGTSRYEAEPSYQYAAQTSGYRETPDVAYDADPSTGVAVYDSLPDRGNSGWGDFGGTSAGAPQWAALIAVADQGRATVGLSALAGPSNTLPTLYGLYATSTYPTDFNDVTAGSTSAAVSAGTGYDEATGLGTPKAAALVAALEKSTLWVQLTQAKTATATTGKLSASVQSALADDAAVVPPPAIAAAPTLATPAVFATGGLDVPAPTSAAQIVVPAAAPTDAFTPEGSHVPAHLPSADGWPTAAADVAPTAVAAAAADVTAVVPPLSTFSLALAAGGPAAAPTAAGPSFAATLAASTRSLHPLALTAAAVGTVLWLATEPARDARRHRVRPATPFGDRLIGLVPLRP